SAEALLAALALLARRRVPGVWVVLTTIDPELPLAPDGGHAPGSSCVGLALALLPARPGWGGLRLRVAARGTVGGGAESGLDLFGLHAAVEHVRSDRRASGV